MTGQDSIVLNRAQTAVSAARVEVRAKQNGPKKQKNKTGRGRRRANLCGDALKQHSLPGVSPAQWRAFHQCYSDRVKTEALAGLLLRTEGVYTRRISQWGDSELMRWQRLGSRDRRARSIFNSDQIVLVNKRQPGPSFFFSFKTQSMRSLELAREFTRLKMMIEHTDVHNELKMHSSDWWFLNKE